MHLKNVEGNAGEGQVVQRDACKTGQNFLVHVQIASADSLDVQRNIACRNVWLMVTQLSARTVSKDIVPILGLTAQDYRPCKTAMGLQAKRRTDSLEKFFMNEYWYQWVVLLLVCNLVQNKVVHNTIIICYLHLLLSLFNNVEAYILSNKVNLTSTENV